VARWGGEEFLVLLPEIDGKTAAEVADRLREAAEKRLGLLSGLLKSVTLSFGLAAYSAEAPIDRLLKSADEALYAGKAAGRNRVVLAESA
jgi:diguanylate cyclase (GGDEF)-like protein